MKSCSHFNEQFLRSPSQIEGNEQRSHVYTKTIVDNEPVIPFSMDLTKDMKAEMQKRNPKVAEMIRELSRLKYGRSREIVEADVIRRAKL